MSTDDIQSWDASGDSLNDFEFCLVTQSTDTEYPFNGVLGFGKPGTDDQAIYSTFVGKMYDQMFYEPIVTFDVGFDDDSSMVSIGDFTPSTDHTDLGTATSDANVDQWAISIPSFTYGNTTGTNSSHKSSSILALEFPYIAIPSDVY
jgi:hypothetical protein